LTFERIGGEEVWRGHVAKVRVDRFRYHDGEVVERDVIEHPGAVVVLPFDGERIWFIRQPREVVEEPSLLELPAGKLDVEGEAPLDVAKRELREEIGKSARNWELLTTFYISPGFTTETMYSFLATDLYDDLADTDESERIEITPEPTERIDAVIRACRDSKSLVTLLWFRAFVLGR
jgi:8-oxo-dGTP pyrophosphatase MutT (NUDIX family)